MSHDSLSVSLVEANTADAALARLSEEPFDAVVLDYVLPGTTGLDLLPRIFDLQPEVVVLITTARGDEEIAAAALKAGAADYVVKSAALAARLPRALLAAVEGARLRAEARRAEARIAHLNSVLLAIRNVDQLITKEKNPARLLERACCLLTDTRGYYSAWIALVDGRAVATEWYGSTGAGARADFLAVAPVEAFPRCGLDALASPGEVLSRHVTDSCSGCPVSRSATSASASCLAMHLGHGDRSFGALFVSLPVDNGLNPEELELFKEVGDDISFALHALEADAERRRSEEDLVRLNRIHLVLTRVNETIIRVRRRHELFQEICRIAVEDGLFRMAWIGLVDPETHFVEPVSWWGHEDGYVQGLRVSIDDIPEGQGPTGRSLREGRYQLCEDFGTDPRVRPWVQAAFDRGYRCSAAFPFVSGGVQGALTLYSGEPLFFDEQRIRLLEALAADIGMALEREQADDRMEVYQSDLRSLASELSLAEERERRRLATELHDSLLQSLAFAKMKLRALKEEAQGPEAAAAAAEAVDLVQEAMTSGRALVNELAAPEYYELGFEAAVHAYAERLQRQHNVAITVADDGAERPLTAEARLTLYHAIRELLNNIVKHADASEAAVSLGRDGEVVCVEVYDNGVGLDASPSRPGEGLSGGFGLFSLRERLRHLGGSLTVEDPGDRGTRLRLCLPIAE